MADMGSEIQINGIVPDTGGVTGAETRQSAPVERARDAQALRKAALELAANLSWLPDRDAGEMFSERCERLCEAFESLFEGVKEAFGKGKPSEDIRWLRDNDQQLLLAARALANNLGGNTALPVVSNKVDILPRVMAIALGFLNHVETSFTKEQFTEFCKAFEEHTPLKFHEVGALVPSLELLLLETIAAHGKAVVSAPITAGSKRLPPYIRIFRYVSQASWKEEIESLLPFDGILRQDPACAFAFMDAETKNLYREKVAQMALRSDHTEMDVARAALALAREAEARTYRDPKIGLRESHIGYYLVAEGTPLLRQRVAYHPTFGERVRIWLRTNPDRFLLVGIAVLALVIITFVLWLLTPPTTPLGTILVSMLILAIPSSQAAVEVMNYLTTNLLEPVMLPKMDYSEGIPEDCVTLVAIPTLLLNEKQVHHLVKELEVRYVGNQDPHIHFAILSDLPDSRQPAPEENELVVLCSRLIQELNERYARRKAGSFLFLHRHRVYNPREKGWMGWERKRGKLMDLNQFLRGKYDPFPVKSGNLAILPKVRYVITLDSDTELPRGSAQRMVGAINHPLNQAIIDPQDNIVVAGYGILQPRVDISVDSTARSRLAAIFVGEVGLDPYTRASSDVYQDLYGEGSFTGKGIYEVDTLLQVLYARFPRNALLSHDLIEGAYARAGLVSDIAVIEDYPSHYSSYNRRKHRWLRGDWQIVQWLTDKVPDESGARVRNPISLVSRWKILDNLRRSLVEPATFVLLLFGWFGMGHPVWWTLATVGIMFVPEWVEFVFVVTRALVARQAGIAMDALGKLVGANLTVLLNLTLLAHQMLLSIDAVVRALVRRLVTRERLLEWETAAEAEMGKRRTPIDRYIDWMPFLAVGLGLLIWLVKPHALWAAMPVLVLWFCSQPFALWLNGSPIAPEGELTERDKWLLRKSALYIWRYFLEFSTSEHNWLIPDNVQDQPRKAAATVSPTNIGLLLNARQAANEFGYLTVPEMLDLTRKTLQTLMRMPKHRGHLMNWYKTHTLEAAPPFFISSVDNGNLVASLWTLRQGLFDRCRQPLLAKALGEGLLDYLRVLGEFKAFPKRELKRYEEELSGNEWCSSILNFAGDSLEQAKAEGNTDAAEIAWFREQAKARVQAVRELANLYMPWKLPEFADLRKILKEGMKFNDDSVRLEKLPDLIAALESLLEQSGELNRNGHRASAERLRSMLADAGKNTQRLIETLRHTAEEAERLASAMNFSFLFDKERMLMSIGYDAEAKELAPYYYDLLATEPRTAIFIAIAKDEIPQEAWFRLGRPLTEDRDPALLSWTGTMFEYMMPAIWMQTYPNTLLDGALKAAVREQQAYASGKGVPWGISESACAKRNPVGDYHYQAFGVPKLALKREDSEPLIIAPYATFLALSVDRRSVLANLRKMESLGWFGAYGFFEAADYTAGRKRFGSPRYELVREWMVHHQGMSLLSLANFLCDRVVQRWFHADARVQATALLLQEKPVASMV
ncbi:MAG TPA: glucoamylase family protein [Candidatus Sulfotelmatobacter sp.]|nr:glucoamylase family protein [Candidatus Sulfotelmatobacter sp.]